MNDFDQIRHLTIGTVDFVSPKEIKVILEIDAPFNIALNTGVPQQFPRINGFLLIPNELGALIGIITWIGIEYSPYPKRKGYRDFDIVDLPFPLRKLSLSPIGILKETGNGYEVRRGVYNYPSVGDVVILPTETQLKAIVQNKDRNARVVIGNSPMAVNTPIFVDPDKLFGRHLAILGNTGSGKSCTVAGLIRWSIESAQEEIDKNKIDKNKDESKTPQVNARFIILDPNGEYGNCFNDLGSVRKYEVKISDSGEARQLKMPSWMWNSWEWISIAQASARTQRPILRRALREIKNADIKDTYTTYTDTLFKYFLVSLKISLINFQKKGADLSKFPEKQNYGEFLENVKKSMETFKDDLINEGYKDINNSLIKKISEILEDHPKSKGYYPAFSLKEVNPLLEILYSAESIIGKLIPYEGPDEDSPVFFKNENFLAHIERLAQESNQQQYFDFFLMRVRSLLTDKRIASVIDTATSEELTLEQWLTNYIGDNNLSITIVDLSLLPSEIIYLIVSVMARIIFEAHHRYKKQYDKTLPTVLVVDEAHNLIKRYGQEEGENISSQKLCTQAFEKIAKEGRKFGLGLIIASQRPSELSQTVLSQCNTFLLHRIVSDRDQEIVKRLVPDAMGGILSELPVLPSRKAILLGWATPVPLLVEIKELPEEQRPKSKDPDFWKVWINEEEREIDWGKIAKEWQGKNFSKEE